jgi:hypothetical protein
MAGLILAGIGKGIADAGAAYAGGMSKMAEFEMQQEREAQREQRQLRLADQLETQKSEKYATKSNEVAAAADIAPTKRAALEAISKLKEISPDPSQVASEEEMTQYMKENPSYKQGLEKSGLIGADKMDPRLRRATDEEAAARSVGAPASMIESLSKAKRDTLSLLSQEWKESQGERRLDIMEKGVNARVSASAGGGVPKVRSSFEGSDGKIAMIMSDGTIKTTDFTSGKFEKKVSDQINLMSKDYNFNQLSVEEKRAKAMEIVSSQPAKPSDNATPPAAPTVKPASGGGKDYSNLWK